MLPLRKAVGRAFLTGYRLSRRIWGKSFSLLAAGGFHAFGRNTVVQPPVRLEGEARIAIGDGVFVGPGCWLQAVGEGDGEVLRIGDGTSIVGDCVFSAASSVVIGERVLFARGSYVADHSHAYADRARAILDQGITKIAPVRIDDGAWLGENVVVCPGVHIGRGAVVGANSVVVRDVPAHAVAVGAPARIVRGGETPPADAAVSPGA